MTADPVEAEPAAETPRGVLLEFDTTEHGTKLGYWDGRHFVSALGEGLWSPQFVTDWRSVTMSAVGAEVRVEWGVRDNTDGRMLWEHMTSQRGAEDFADASHLTVVRRTVSTSPWEEA